MKIVVLKMGHCLSPWQWISPRSPWTSCWSNQASWRTHLSPSCVRQRPRSTKESIMDSQWRSRDTRTRWAARLDSSLYYLNLLCTFSALKPISVYGLGSVHVSDATMSQSHSFLTQTGRWWMFLIKKYKLWRSLSRPTFCGCMASVCRMSAVSGISVKPRGLWCTFKIIIVGVDPVK